MGLKVPLFAYTCPVYRHYLPQVILSPHFNLTSRTYAYIDHRRIDRCLGYYSLWLILVPTQNNVNPRLLSFKVPI